MKNKDNTIKINKFLLVGIVLLFCLIIIKLIYVNLSNNVDGIDLTVFATNRNTAKETLYATRGTIYDTSGEILAKNVNSYILIAYLEPSRTTDIANPRHVIDKQSTAEALATILDMTAEDILTYLNKTRADGTSYYQVQFGTKGGNLTELTKKAIEKLSLPGIDFIASTGRYYENASFASYILGYARKNDSGEIVGEMGIEKQYNSILKGTDGYTQYEKDIYGYQIPNTPSKTENPESGSDIYLTIDNSIQLMLENTISSFSKKNTMEWMTISVADAKTGAILASSSNPSFNPNDPGNTIETYTNPLTEYQYEPGSTMKIFTFMAAMESGTYKGSDKYASGATTIGEYTVSDFNNVGWGTITYDEGFAYSSNIAAVNLSKKLGRVQLREYFEKLGFGTKTGIELPNEYSGELEFYYDIEVANAAFGQGITTTPIQNIQALTAIANDGVMVKPYIIDKIIDASGEISHQSKRTEIERVASSETIKKMKELMYDVVYSEKTTAKYFMPKNTTLIGKTGTAQIAENGKYLTGENNYVRSFAGLFPAEKPQYIIYFSVKKYIGSYKELGNAIADIIDAIAKKDTSISDTESNVDESKIVYLESYLNKNIEEVSNKLKEMNLEPIVLGTGDTVINQYPSKSTKVPVGTKVFLKTNKKEYTMPNVTGWSTNEIITFCNMIGLHYSLDGFGNVVGTNFETGSLIDLNQILNIELK